MDDALRNSTWNLLYSLFESEDSRLSGWTVLARRVAIGFLMWPADQVPGAYQAQSRDWLFKHFSRLEWYRVYDLLEFVAGQTSVLESRRWTGPEFMAVTNAVLERELSGFRFVRGRLTRLTGDEEVRAIEEAARKAGLVGLGGVETHLDEALRMLGLRPTPDYRNSIKESISAVESAVKCISGIGSGGLADALDSLAKKMPIHPALKDGLNRLYGYSSNEDGIRHAILEEPTVGYDEAKFMLVACSAFAHFLIAKVDAAGLLKR